MEDKFRILVPARRPAKPKKVWNIKDDQDWTAFGEAVTDLLPADDLESSSVDSLATLLVTALREGGEKAIGYKKPVSVSSMRSRSLPSQIVAEMQLKSEMESNYKTLSSSKEASWEVVAAAEKAV